MLHYVIIGLVLFSIIKIIAFIKVADIYFPKIEKDATKQNKNDSVSEDNFSKLDEAQKYKRDYFK